MPFDTGYEQIPLDTELFAEVDLMVMATADSKQSGGNGPRGTIYGEIIFSDETGDFMPFAQASVHEWHPDNIWNPHQSFTMPVPKGSRYRIRTEVTDPGVQFAAWRLKII